MAGYQRRAMLWATLVAAVLFTAWTAVWPTKGNQILRWFREFPSRTAVFRGHYSSGFEESSFRPCGSAERWWLEVSEKNYDQWSTAMAPHKGRTYIELRGTRTGKGQYGHLGLYDRGLNVIEVILARPPDLRDCK